MDEALKKSGDYPNIAIMPGTHRHAATGEPVEIPASARVGGASSDSDAVVFCKRVERAAKERAPLELFGVRYEAVDNEPFCETVYRWLHGDAPGECRECADGKYDELMTALVDKTCTLKPLPAIAVTMNMLNEIGWCKCSKCGYSTPDESNYCQNCGRKVKHG